MPNFEKVFQYLEGEITAFPVTREAVRQLVEAFAREESVWIEFEDLVDDEVDSMDEDSEIEDEDDDLDEVDKAIQESLAAEDDSGANIPDEELDDLLDEYDSEGSG